MLNKLIGAFLFQSHLIRTTFLCNSDK